MLCPLCNEALKPGETQQMHELRCPKVMVACGIEGCHKEFPRDAVLAHRARCEWQMLTCECGEMVIRKKMAAHKNGECPVKEVTCSFNCGWKGLVRDAQAA